MIYKMYLLNISDLEEESLQQTAMALMDSHRQELVQKYATEKDRMRAIAAGLLLQAGFLELEPTGEYCQTISGIEGTCYILEGKSFLQYLQKYAKRQYRRFPVELVYEKGTCGKPFWAREAFIDAGFEKKLLQFNLSHSGDYVVLVVADREVGVDIQEPRKVDKYPGGFKAFSRMEAYVKCTGEGYAQGFEAYEQNHGNIPGYEILSMDIVENYAIHLCFPV